MSVQRRSPLRRTTGLKRSGALASSQALKASVLRKVPVRTSPAERAAAKAFWEDVCLDAKGRLRPCAVCGSPSRDAHHVFAKQKIKSIARTLRWTQEETMRRVWASVDGMPVCRACHDAHENASKPIPVECVPPAALAFVGWLDEMTGTKAATDYITNHYGRSHGD